ncbi:MAG: PTS sugar transporter subunit IIA [bacterium]
MITEQIIKYIDYIRLHTSDMDQVYTRIMDMEHFDRESEERIISLMKQNEKILSTNNGNNVIFPRYCLEDRDNYFRIIIGVNNQVFEYAGKTVGIIVMILYSEDKRELFIDSLAYLIRIFQHKSLPGKLIEMDSESEIEEIIEKLLKEIED